MLPLALSQAIEMPAGAQILHVGVQMEQIVCIWALVDENAPMEERSFAVVGTGHPVPENTAHVGSVLMHGGAFVWHVFEHEG